LQVGTNTLGACDFIQRDRCLYATVLRDPVARLLSSWRYFCVQGAENKKGWDRGWTKCAWSIEQWAAMQPAQLTLDLSTNQAPTQRVARSNQTATCPLLADGPASERTGKRGEEHLAAALANLDATRRDSPVRVLLVDDLERGLRALAIELGVPAAEALAKFAALSTNVAASSSAPDAVDAATLGRVRETLGLDVRLYEKISADVRATYDAAARR